LGDHIIEEEYEDSSGSDSSVEEKQESPELKEQRASS